MAPGKWKQRLQQKMYNQRGLRKRASVIGKSLNEVKEFIDRPGKKKK